jgi:hypothetical protein
MTQATDEAKQRITELLERDGLIIVSEGTLRDVDLIAKFTYWLGIDPESVHDQQEYVSDLAMALEDAAPDGFQFSSHEGDGACIGFWKSDDDG